MYSEEPRYRRSGLVELGFDSGSSIVLHLAIFCSVFGSNWTFKQRQNNTHNRQCVTDIVSLEPISGWEMILEIQVILFMFELGLVP